MAVDSICATGATFTMTMLSVLFVAVLGSAATHSHDYGTDINVPIVELQLFDAGGRLLAGGPAPAQGRCPWFSFQILCM